MRPRAGTGGCRRQVASLVHLSPDDEVLDAACGYGRHALGLLERVCRVVGLDYGQTLVEAVRAEAEGRGLAGARFVWGNMLQSGLGAFPCRHPALTRGT